MAYEVLARKWRPATFTTMAGQEHVLRALINALAGDRLHHAYLFTGTRGVGKTTIARILAKCLNCEQGVTPEPCGTCSSCVEIAEGRCVDLIEVDAASRSRVEETRELLENVQYAPTRSRYKVYLIDEVHMMSGASFNALLKTLEEPPPHVKFLLATTDPKKLPVTVLSRCLQFHLKNLTPERIVGHLQAVLTAEQVEFEDEALWALARAADGSMRDALSLTDQAIAFGAGRLAADDVARMLGTIDQGALERILIGLADGDGEALLACSADLAEHAADFPAVLRELMAALHRVSVVQMVPAAAPAGAGTGDQAAALLVTMAGRLTPEDVQLFYQIALTGQRDLPFAPDPRTGFEMTLLRMLAFRPETPERGERPAVAESGSMPAAGAALAAPAATRAAVADDAAAAVTIPSAPGASPDRPEAPAPERSPDAGAGARHPLRSVPSEPGAPAPEVPDADTTPAAADGPGEHPEPQTSGRPEVRAGVLLATAEDWHAVVGALEVEGLTAELVNHCMPERIEPGSIRLLLDPAAESLDSELHVGRLETALTRLLGRTLRVELRVGEAQAETPARQAARLRAERQTAAEQAIAADANVRRLIETFNASVQRESIRPMG